MFRVLSASLVMPFLAPVVAGDSRIFDVTRSGQMVQSNGFSISGGYAYSRKKYPAVTFGTVQPPGGTREFTYVVLSKSDGKTLTVPSIECHLDVKGLEATDKSTIEMNGKKIGLVYTVRIDRGVIVAEELTMNERKVDLRNGRVLLVDFSKDATWTQVKAGLPEHLGDPRKPDSLTAMATKLVEQLRENPSVRDFLK